MGAKVASRTKPGTYLDLVRAFPLVHIRDDRHLAEASAVIDALLMRGVGADDAVGRDEGAEAYLEVLTDLVESYESGRDGFPDAPPGDVLRELMRSGGLTQAELARRTGIAQSTISAILTATRKPTADQVVRLGEYFGVDPAAFLPRGSGLPLGTRPAAVEAPGYTHGYRVEESSGGHIVERPGGKRRRHA